MQDLAHRGGIPSWSQGTRCCERICCSVLLADMGNPCLAQRLTHSTSRQSNDSMLHKQLLFIWARYGSYAGRFARCPSDGHSRLDTRLSQTLAL